MSSPITPMLQACCAPHLEIEVIIQAQHAVFVCRVVVVDVPQQLDLVKALIEVVLVILRC